MKNWKNKIWIFAILLTSCGGSDTKFMELDRESRFYLDTSASRKINRLAGEYDTICTSRKDALVKQYADSLLQIRRQEIQRQLTTQ